MFAEIWFYKPLTIKHRDMHSPIAWTGDLQDDCSAKFAGLVLRAEWMDNDLWWWCIYDMNNGGIQIDSSNNYNRRPNTGEVARKAAEHSAFKYLGIIE